MPNIVSYHVNKLRPNVALASNTTVPEPRGCFLPETPVCKSSKVMADVNGVLDLPQDALLHIFTLLSVPDICRSSQTCRKLRSIARQVPWHSSVSNCCTAELTVKAFLCHDLGWFFSDARKHVGA